MFPALEPRGSVKHTGEVGAATVEFAVKLCTENLLRVTELSLVATQVQLVP
ncbi:uncharacterized protein PHACADRAFT_202679 [Phanerochaete carnosa HHB-10118-sp]|uniref:Uncharacterized protein n=1 Tax=Phanerochaete carnosa (strain HHB-10118-sp) TaxID=650164 RepID=K5VPP1_PHACS|nr:uncharacterized protein PHACADRAFT_202679 [Phanerochaete carnosa HHB-10118-sp]EKM48549.1 hypothetical protein PHACADRAFT_202679 [Phanerochaete carnosa HHB-10118-sp]